MHATPPAPAEQVEQWGRAVADRLHRLLGEELLAAYLVGSGALGDFVPEQSDVDLVAVCAHTPLPERKQAIIDALAEQATTWPVRGLEFVLYARAAVATPSPTPRFEINLNVGRRMPLHVSLDPASEPAHWFVVDLAILREHGVALAGPPAQQLVAPIPRPWLLGALWDSLAWHAAHESMPHQTVLNACRAWRYVQEGVWSSKDDAAGWALPRAKDPSLVAAAVAIRHGDSSRGLDPIQVQEFVRGVQAKVERAMRTEEHHLQPSA
jgi:hypothetical protein